MLGKIFREGVLKADDRLEEKIASLRLVSISSFLAFPILVVNVDQSRVVHLL